MLMIFEPIYWPRDEAESIESLEYTNCVSVEGFGLVWFHSIPTIVGYLKSNHFNNIYIYIKYMIHKYIL